MKTKYIAVSILVATTAVVSAYPFLTQPKASVVLPLVVPEHNQQQQIEVVFVLDTTGSMGGLLQTAKEKIWSIATTMASAKGAPQIKMGLVAYRDRGDAYVTKVYDLTTDLDSLYAQLMDFKAEGGGDGPEDVNQALYDSVNAISWSTSTKTFKTIFVVGDAPPHMDYQNQIPFQQSLNMATLKGITVNTIQCGNQLDTLQPWKQIAALGSGTYFQVEQAGGAVAINTPLDRKIAELSKKLDETKLYYGNKKQQERQASKQKATDKIHKDLSFASRARRAEYNASASGRKNFLGENELIDDIASGKIKLDKIKPQYLPASIAALPPKKQVNTLKKIHEDRIKLNQLLKKATDERSAYLKSETQKLGDLKDSLDEKIYSVVKQQAEEKGIEYEADSAKY